MNFTHVKTADLDIVTSLHVSHLHKYVSAYVTTTEMVDQLIKDIDFAMKEAKSTGKVQIVDQNGECCFHISPNGYITLMLPWRCYQIVEDVGI